VADLGEATGYSCRQLQRIMLRYAGFPPKTFLELLRFEDCKAMPEGPADGRGLLTIALDSGYYDQSHMIREFSRFSGLPTGRYVRSVQ
jgi:transcriptional regulator GlxA family with amidase domain